MSRVPDGWQVVRIDQVADVRNGMTPSRSEPRYWSNGVYPWLPTSKVHERLIAAADEFISQAALDECSIRIFPAGSVLVGMIGQGITRGKAAYLAIDAAINQNFACIVPGHNLHGLYAFHYLDNQYEELRNISQGSNQGSLNCKTVGSFKILLPSLAEQRKIAQILSTWDEAIALVEALIAALKRRKQGLMQRLLTGEVRFPGFEGEWQEVRLGEICERITKGSTPTTYGYSYVDQGINFIAVESVSETGKFLVEKFRHITEENHQVFSRSQLENGDVLISIAGALGRTAIVRSDILPANTNQALAIVRLRDADDTLRQYVRYSLGSQQIAQRIMQITSQSAQPNLNLADISQLPLNMPSHSETMQIVTILTESESAIDLLDEYRMVIREQKRGLMQRLLTGEVRVQID